MPARQAAHGGGSGTVARRTRRDVPGATKARDNAYRPAQRDPRPCRSTWARAAPVRSVRAAFVWRSGRAHASAGIRCARAQCIPGRRRAWQVGAAAELCTGPFSVQNSAGRGRCGVAPRAPAALCPGLRGRGAVSSSPEQAETHRTLRGPRACHPRARPRVRGLRACDAARSARPGTHQHRRGASTRAAEASRNCTQRVARPPVSAWRDSARVLTAWPRAACTRSPPCGPCRPRGGPWAAQVRTAQPALGRKQQTRATEASGARGSALALQRVMTSPANWRPAAQSQRATPETDARRRNLRTCSARPAQRHAASAGARADHAPAHWYDCAGAQALGCMAFAAGLRPAVQEQEGRPKMAWRPNLWRAKGCAQTRTCDESQAVMHAAAEVTRTRTARSI